MSATPPATDRRSTLEGLAEASRETLKRIERRRFELLGLATFVVVVYAVGIAASILPSEHPLADEYSSTLRVLRFALIPLSLGFAAYLWEKERQLRRLTREAYELEVQASERLRLLYRTKDALLTAVSHEVRTPLTKALGSVRVLEDRLDDLTPEQTRTFVEQTTDNLEVLERMLEDLIDLDRLWRDVVELSRRETDVSELARRVVEHTDLGGRSAVVVGEGITGRIDGPKVERMIENLLANVKRHTPVGTSAVVRVERDGDDTVIVVEDDGPGVPPGLREAVFRPFRSGPHAPEHAPGTGIGLTLVERLAELHGGRAWIVDREGGGTAVWIRLPASDEPPAGEARLRGGRSKLTRRGSGS